MSDSDKRIKVDLYSTMASIDCSERGRILVLCNNSTHFIVAYQDEEDDAVDDNKYATRIASFSYALADDNDNTRPIYRAALVEAINQALSR